ncbi:MAG: polysaccharide lyase [Sphingobacterium sp.]|jgi:hypothetical protein|nr:polysaccharide lyase [Sphingobacterium sp.]
MKRICLHRVLALAVSPLLVAAISCAKKGNDLANKDQMETSRLKANLSLSNLLPGDTLLNVDYETGTSSSGIIGVTATHATAADAAYMVQPGARGAYAIAHKIVYGDSSYYSAGNWRSESDADYAANARFMPEQERRYEFSVLLKDWTLNPNDATEGNLFQLKQTGDNGVPLQIRTMRNAIVLRFDKANNQPNVTVLANAQQYVNKWIHFRVDVLWSQSGTGYMKTYMKLPGEPAYSLKDSKTNYKTYTANALNGQHGYIKWGLYIVPTNTTRIVYHDDIRIIGLN